jgi:UDP-glucose 4-epimerase
VTVDPVSDNHPLRVVLVTGVSRYLGAQVAARLAGDPRVKRVIGLDDREPTGDQAAVLADVVEFERADICTAEPARIITGYQVEVVVHLDITSGVNPKAGGRAAMKEQNVIGTMQLLAACQQAPALHKIVVRSSTAAYGASFRDPAVFTEDTEPREVPRGGFAKDVLDIEGYVRGFRRRRPDVAATVLRFAPMIGHQANTSLTRYFSSPVVPTVLGRDPRLQFIHVDDALEILHRSVLEHHPGTYNVAGAGVIMLSQAVRRAGRIALPLPERGLSAFGRSGANFSLDQLDLLVHGRVVDTTRLVDEYGYTPRPTSVAFADFLRGTGAVLPSDAIKALERTLLAGIRQSRAVIIGRDGRA